jgi:hypothetical protein
MQQTPFGNLSLQWCPGLSEAEFVYFDIDADGASIRTQIILIRSSEPRSWPKDVPAKYACPCIKQSAGFAISTGMRISAVAFLRVQSPRSGVTEAEQIRTRAVSIVIFSILMQRLFEQTIDFLV